MSELVGDVSATFRGYEEIRYVGMSTAGNQTSISVELTKRNIRKSLGQKSVFELEKIWLANMKKLEEK